MSFIRDRAHETSDNGLLLENGIWFTSGASVPTHSANAGDRFFQTNGDRYRFSGSVWIKLIDTTEDTGASPGFVFDALGVVPGGSYLANNNNPSNIVGVPIAIGSTPKLTNINVLNKTSQIFSITVQEHDQITFTDIVTKTVTPAAKGQNFPVDISITDGLQLAVKIDDATANNPQNPKVVCIMKGG